jgi:acyl-CoA dehydrogenase
VACRAYVTQLGAAGWLKYAVPRAYGGALDAFDVRSICLIRETLGYASGLAEFAFAMQGLGSGPISLFGSESLKRKYLPGVAAGNLDRRLCHLGIQCRLRSLGDADHRPA